MKVVEEAKAFLLKYVNACVYSYLYVLPLISQYSWVQTNNKRWITGCSPLLGAESQSQHCTFSEAFSTHSCDQSATVHQCADLHLVVFPSLSVEIYMQHIHAIHAASRLGDFELCWTLYLLYRWRLPSSVCFEQRNKDCNLCPWRTASVIRGCVRSLCYLCKCRLVKPVNTGVCGHTYRSVCCTHFSRCWHTVLCTPNHHHPMTTVITSSYQADWIETQFNRIK